MSDSLFSTFLKLKGNTRACVYTEPLWGLSMNLCMPYLAKYMAELDISHSRIGFFVTVNIVSQIICSFLSGPITDKIGRRKATAIFDFISWSIPCLFWWHAEGFWFFLIAAILNGGNAITVNSWNCLLIEDAEKKQITRIYSLVIAFGQLSAIFAPITAALISKLTIIPAIKILFINAFVLMTLKIIILYLTSKETSTGKMRLIEAKGKNIFQLAGGYKDIIKMIFKSRGMVFSIIIAALAMIVSIINITFWQIIATKKLFVPDDHLPYYLIFRSGLAIVFLFFVIPRLLKGNLRIPLLLAFASYFIGQFLLISIPVDGMFKYPLILVSLVFDGFGLAALNMACESLIAIYVNPNERAGIFALRYMFIMIVAAPFGWIGGILSEINKNLPFILNMVILAAGTVLTLIHYRKKNDHSAEH